MKCPNLQVTVDVDGQAVVAVDIAEIQSDFKVWIGLTECSYISL